MPHSRTAVVTGAARGIGLAAAERLVAAGHRVALVDHDTDVLERAVKDLPIDQVIWIAADVTARDAPARIAAAIAVWPEVDILVNNAGKSLKRDGRSPGLAQM